MESYDRGQMKACITCGYKRVSSERGAASSYVPMADEGPEPFRRYHGAVDGSERKEAFVWCERTER